MIMRKTYKHARRSGPSPVVILLAVLLTVLCVNLAVVVALVRSTPEKPGEPLMEAVTTAPPRAAHHIISQCGEPQGNGAGHYGDDGRNPAVRDR